METVFLVPTETYAEKTKRLLAQYRLPYHMQRVTAAEGCTARFVVRHSPDVVLSLLRGSRIPYRSGG